MTRLFWWLATLGLTTVAVIASWAWLDRPIATWVHAHHVAGYGQGLFRPLTRIPDPLIPLGAFALISLGLWSLAGRRLTRLSSFVVVCCFGVIATETVKDGLKWVFGRPPPDSWQGSGPAFIGTGDYGFHWFAGGGDFSSFPSGHMAAAAAVLSALWIYYPRTRALCVAAGVAVAIALVGSNFHFLGDVLAGAFLGASIGLITVSLFNQRPTD